MDELNRHLADMYAPLYSSLLSRVKHLDMVLDILAFILLTKIPLSKKVWFIEAVFNLKSGKLQAYLRDLAAQAVLRCEPAIDANGEVEFLYASFPIFLLEKRRSGTFHISCDEHGSKLASMLLAMPPSILDPHSSTDNLNIVSSHEVQQLEGIWALLFEGPKPSNQLRKAFLRFDIMFYDADVVEQATKACLGILECVDKLVSSQTCLFC
jgi:hypothetical protein